ncbi:MAG: oligopeptide ABC transporter ATP-binding protein [Bdellovibrio sp. CG12_big_fil_rev_8_21_14_0_65_39_13]|nr:MAG: oligopeptide ABC transporter ATP-binding protein [Bdellovibrio sp. CG22_combo_CG10-13_8_21_14_all_39_27]PIQ58727.1 MAG: oligopeptide ABC transporter ATP-binding protein [Bdellovibrio sp. CG12_big_fil_rev_8_21_14_0_65_39_13]PIR33102.1 MAG: oligopeptide ABC transporter ATP-binding protein [Bdellovibrio sp. CG11_big_fil_rev_8_21_14_0_20_39_38]PJB53052.1 MAG: oligopeptide ABC transporter ATP-binding protein [Bdellovibrio sp. CG_4_9_14_3_um_filter_39_7]
MSDYLLEVKGLTKRFPIKGGLLGREVGAVNAVNNVSFSIKRGETLGLVGESGCGKTTLGRSLLRLIEPSAGQVLFGGQDITKFDALQMREIRRKMQIIFQDPYASLNPRMTIGSILSEPMEIHGLFLGRTERQNRLYQLLDQVQLPKDALNKYPHEFSGGQRQRVCIARALAVEPEFIVCDEPVSALDVSVQAQVVNLLMDLQSELKLTYLFIAHDLKVVEYISNRVAVMYLGNMIEVAESSELYGGARHPYTKALFSAIPKPNPNIHMDRILLEGDIPSPMNPPTGCHFHPRCWKVTDQCKAAYPAVTAQSQTHEYRCHNPI